MNKNLLIVIVAAVIAAGAGFFVGMKYGQARALNPKTIAAMSQEQRQQLFAGFRSGNGGGGGFGGRGGAGGRGANGGGFVAGEILSKDDKSITVKMSDGSSKIVFVGASTTVEKPATSTFADLLTGQQVVVMGQTNSDGSVTAQNIQVRLMMQNQTPPNQ